MTAHEHIQKARLALARSDEALTEVAAEIRKALDIDASLTMEAIGASLGRSASWVSALLRWDETHVDGEAMFGADTTARLRRAMRQGLRELSGETIAALMEEAGVHPRHLMQPEYFAKDGTYIGPPYQPQNLGTVEHFRRYQLSRMSAWGMRYDWNKMHENEKRELAPQIRQALNALVTEVEEMLAEVAPKRPVAMIGA